MGRADSPALSRTDNDRPRRFQHFLLGVQTGAFILDFSAGDFLKRIKNILARRRVLHRVGNQILKSLDDEVWIHVNCDWTGLAL